MKRETAAVIMIVDDEPENLRVLTALLSDNGFIVRSFPDATRALRSAKSDPPDLILLDIRMPTMDGFEFCAHLKATPSLKNIPVLFLSAADEVENESANPGVSLGPR